MKTLLMFLRAVKSIFTEYAKIRANIFDKNINRGLDKDMGAEWTEFAQDNNDAQTREQKATSKVKDRDTGVRSRAISTLGFDGIMPETERRGNPKRKQHSENPYRNYKSGKGRLKKQKNE